MAPPFFEERNSFGFREQLELQNGMVAEPTVIPISVNALLCYNGQVTPKKIPFYDKKHACLEVKSIQIKFYVWI